MIQIESKLLSILPTGKENARTGRELAAIISGWELRDITKEICRLRRAGIPICGYNSGEVKGYALANGNTDELDIYCRRFHKRLAEIKKTLAALEAYRDSQINNAS